MGDSKPRILIITPEITYLPSGMGNMANRLRAKAGGLADVSAALVSTLYEAGMDVHVALPNYRTMFNRRIGKLITEKIDIYRSILSEDRIHLAEDRCFYYRDKVYDNYASQNLKQSLAFQREVVNNILPRVHPDLIHCNDWMTGLIPAIARRLEIPSLFTVHNIHTIKTTLEKVEDMGIDAAQFWPYAYYERPPQNYEETRSNNPIDFLTTGVFAATAINTVSPTFLTEIIGNRHSFVPKPIVKEFTSKYHKGQAIGVLNAPDPSYHPTTDEALAANFDADSHREGKAKNKDLLQRMLGLERNLDAPMFFWPSRLDPVQKGCDLFGAVFQEMIQKYHQDGLQIVVVANGPFQKDLHAIVRNNDLVKRASVCDFEEGLSRLGYAAADYLFMPSKFEPCGLPQMIGPKYGTLPVAFDTGGIHDTVKHVSVGNNSGNGFLFEIHDVAGLRWAIDQAMQFHRLPKDTREAQVSRIMREADATFSQEVNTGKYLKIYEHLLSKKDAFKNHNV